MGSVLELELESSLSTTSFSQGVSQIESTETGRKVKSLEGVSMILKIAGAADNVRSIAVPDVTGGNE